MQVDLREESSRKFRRLINMVSPGYKKRYARVDERTHYTDHGTYWDGGSRSIAFLVKPNKNTVAPIGGPVAPPQFGGGEAVTIEIGEDEAVVVVGTFRGKTAVAHVIIPPAVDEARAS